MNQIEVVNALQETGLFEETEDGKDNTFTLQIPDKMNFGVHSDYSFHAIDELHITPASMYGYMSGSLKIYIDIYKIKDIHIELTAKMTPDSPSIPVIGLDLEEK